MAATDCAQAQSAPDMAQVPFAVAPYTSSDDRVAFEIIKPRARSNAPGLLSHVALQSLDATVFVKHLTVQLGAQSIELPVRRVLGPGDGTGPIDLRTGGALVRSIVVHVQANAQSAGRVALYVPAGSAAAAGIVAPAGSAAALAAGTTDPGMIPVGRYIAIPGVERHLLRLGQSKGRFTKLAVRVQEGAIGLNAVRVVYNTGEVQMVPFGRPLGAGDHTGEIALERDTFISEVQFALSPLAGVRAVLDVYGTYAEGWTGETGESKTYTAGWVMLGIRRATREHLAQGTGQGTGQSAGVPDDPRIAAGLGRFKKLRFVAREGSVSLGSMTVLFDDGERTSLQVGQALARDQTSQPVTIEDGGRGRGIAAIAMPPASRSAARRDGYVEVWGQH